MLSSRNIHFAILGIILGASSGYVFAFYRAQSSQAPPALTEPQADAGMPPNHPGVNNEQMLAAMKKAVEADPNQPEVLKRYAMALFDSGHFDEAGKWFGKAVALEPRNVETRSMYGAVLWRMGDKEGAGAQLEETLKIDPRNIPSLHGLTLLAIEKQDAVRAAGLIKRIESIEPAYDQLPELRTRLQAIGSGK
jgi:cytochrome c-type biogenesis protein CcmH/NrfG